MDGMPLPALPPALATSAIVIKWNTRAAPSRIRFAYGLLTAVNGREATVRLKDGTVRTYEAPASEIDALRARIGTTIAFRLP